MDIPITEIKFACPHCGRHLAAEHDMAGMELDCPDCGKPLRVPAAPAVANSGRLETDANAPERNASPAKPNALDRARGFGKKAATTTIAVSRPILRAIKEKWNALDPKNKKRVIFSAGGLAALFLLISLLSGGKPKSRDAEREPRETPSKQTAEQRRKNEEGRIAENDRDGRIDQAERAARDVLRPLDLKPSDFGWKRIPDSPKSPFGEVAKTALENQAKGAWNSAAVCLVSLDEFKILDKKGVNGFVDGAACIVRQIQKRARMFETRLSGDFCHFEPRIHVQDSIKNKVTVSLKGKHLADCIRKQREKNWLELINAILAQNGDKRQHEVYPPFGEGELRSVLDHSGFSLVCKTDIENDDNSCDWVRTKEPQLGFLTIRVLQACDGSIGYHFGPVQVVWTEFREKLPSDDGYMKQGWNLLVSDVYVLHTNYRETYEPLANEMRKRISEFREKKEKEVSLGDLTEDEAKEQVLDFAQNEAAAFAKLVESGKPAAEYQVKLNKAKEDAAAETAAQAEAARKDLEDMADRELFSKINSEMKVYVSESIAAKGVTISISGKNAKRWKELQQAKAEKDWRRVCEILLGAEKKRKDEFGERDIFEAGYELEHQFRLKFIISIRGENITKSYEVVDFLGNSDFIAQSGLDNYVDDSFGNNDGTTYKIERRSRNGDFAIMQFENSVRFISEMGEWRDRSRKAERELAEKMRDKDITETEYAAQLKKAREEIKKDFVKKYSLVPVELTMER